MNTLSTTILASSHRTQKVMTPYAKAGLAILLALLLGTTIAHLPLSTTGSQPLFDLISAASFTA